MLSRPVFLIAICVFAGIFTSQVNGQSDDSSTNSRRWSGSGTGMSRESSVGSTLDRQSGARSGFNRESSVGSTLDRQSGASSGFNRETSVGSTVDRQSGAGSGFNRESSIGSTLDRQSGVSSSFNREPSVGSTFDRPSGAGSGFNREPSVGSTFDRQSGVSSSFNREPSVGSTFDGQSRNNNGANREFRVGPTFNGQSSVSSVTDQESSFGMRGNQGAGNRISSSIDSNIRVDSDRNSNLYANYRPNPSTNNDRNQFLTNSQVVETIRPIQSNERLNFINDGFRRNSIRFDGYPGQDYAGYGYRGNGYRRFPNDYYPRGRPYDRFRRYRRSRDDGLGGDFYANHWNEQ